MGLASAEVHVVVGLILFGEHGNHTTMVWSCKFIDRRAFDVLGPQTLAQYKYFGIRPQCYLIL